MHVFVTVMHWGSMAKAAQQLNVTQPAVSKAIADLEHTLGVRLLDRRPQGIEPTMYGRALLKRSNAVFDELKQSIRDIEFLTDPTVGEVRFGCHDSVVASLLPPIMKRFSQRYPRVALHLEVIGPVGAAPQLPSLHQRLIDFAIFRRSTPLADQQIGDELNVEILFSDQLVVAAGRHSRWARRRKIDLAELIAEPGSCQGPIVGITLNWRRRAGRAASICRKPDWKPSPLPLGSICSPLARILPPSRVRPCAFTRTGSRS